VHAPPVVHGAHAPPQSTSVSSPSRNPSVHEGGLQNSFTHTLGAAQVSLHFGSAFFGLELEHAATNAASARPTSGLDDILPPMAGAWPANADCLAS